MIDSTFKRAAQPPGQAVGEANDFLTNTAITTTNKHDHEMTHNV
jgi:hypothetical protein